MFGIDPETIKQVLADISVIKAKQALMDAKLDKILATLQKTA